MERQKIISFIKKYIIFFILIAIVVYFSIEAPGFRTWRSVRNITRQLASTGICAVGMTFVLLIGGIDLSVGSQIAFVNVLCAHMIVDLGVPIPLAILVCILIAMATGFIMGTMVAVIKMPAFIATLIFYNVLEGIALLISGGVSISGFPEHFTTVGQGYLFQIPIPVYIMILVFAVGAILMNRTSFGRYLFAIGGNAEAARLSGINVTLITQIVYTMSGFFAAFSGLITLSRLNSGSPQTGSGFEFDVITAVVLGGVSTAGGVGNFYCMILGVVIMGVLSSGLTMLGISDYAQLIVKGAVLAFSVCLDSLKIPEKSSKKHSSQA